MSDSTERCSELEDVLGLVASPGFRLGSSTRSGYGELALIRCHRRSFDLKDADDRAAWLGLSGRLGDVSAFEEVEVKAASAPALFSVSITLTPTEPWLVGGGEGVTATNPEGSSSSKDGKGANMNPITQDQVIWTPIGKGKIEKRHCFLLPASSVKGALRHRTAFHLRAAKGLWAHSEDVLAKKASGGGDGMDPWTPDSLPGLGQLFGSGLNHKGDGDEAGQAGLVWISDVRVPKKDVDRRRAMHVSLDRFTGGARAGLLFSEDVLEGKTPLELKVQVAHPPPEPNGDAAVTSDLSDALGAFALALEDLCAGHLQLGGGSGRGRGWFQAKSPDLSKLKGVE